MSPQGVSDLKPPSNVRRATLIGAGFVVALLVIATMVRLRVLGGSGNPSLGTRISSATQVSERHWQVPRNQVRAYLSDQGRLNHDIVLKPTTVAGSDSISELRIFSIASDGPMYTAGFRKDDRILQVNATPVATLSRTINLVHEIEACTRLTVQVARDGNLIEYQFDFE